VGRLLMLDGRNMTWTDIRLPRNPLCPVCGAAHPQPESSADLVA
jgi:molybdopterin/thiamine biosynthesis adenylyltransferase